MKTEQRTHNSSAKQHATIQDTQFRDKPSISQNAHKVDGPEKRIHSYNPKGSMNPKLPTPTRWQRVASVVSSLVASNNKCWQRSGKIKASKIGLGNVEGGWEMGTKGLGLGDGRAGAGAGIPQKGEQRIATRKQAVYVVCLCVCYVYV